MHPDMAKLLTSYVAIFEKPGALPPLWLHDHNIPLLLGTNPIKVKPYRYLDSQKMQIETMVQDMLHEGIIQSSRSPFSSPVLLVK